MTKFPLRSGRAQCIIHRKLKVLMVQHAQDEDLFWCLPGGAIESGETPQQAAQRELREECQVSALIKRELSRFTDVYGDTHYTFLADIAEQEPRLGSDPELASDSQVLRAVAWIGLDELAERDRVYLWTAGLLSVEGFYEETERWPRKKAYPL
jgi:8-oxo-dGTP diphosphatase